LVLSRSVFFELGPKEQNSHIEMNCGIKANELYRWILDIGYCCMALV
jgi:hypothetical protein